MKTLASSLAAAVAAALVLAAPSVARAEEKMLGTVTRIDVAAGGAAATATLKDARSGQLVDISVQDTVTLEKFKDHRIGVGDEIKAKYEAKDGKNLATYFKKAGGC